MRFNLLNKIEITADKIYENIYVSSVRNAFNASMPVIIIGAFSTLINNFPLQAYQNFMVKLLGENWKNFGNQLWTVTFAMSSLIMALCVSYFFASSHRSCIDDKTHPLIASIIGITAVFVFIMPVSEQEITQLPMKWLGSTGTFVSMTVSLFSTQVFLWLCSFRHTNKFEEITESISIKARRSYIAAFFTIVFLILIKFILYYFTGIESIYTFVYDGLNTPFMNTKNNFGTAFLFVFIAQLLWFCGIHGTKWLEPISFSLFISAMEANTEAIASGNTAGYIINQSFLENFVFMGGAGASFCLIAAIFIGTKRSSNTRILGKYAIGFGLFNIQEVIIYGLPVVLNPFYLIPFLIVPIIFLVTSYCATVVGLVPIAIDQVDSAMPLMWSGYYATGGHFSGSILQLLNFIIGIVIYLPFVKMAEKRDEKNIRKKIYQLGDLVNQDEIVVPNRLIARADDLGSLARLLVLDLHDAITNGSLHLEYQPQVNNSEKVEGVEALIRWNHNSYGYIPPHITIALAEESKQMEALGTWVIETVCRQNRIWQERGIENIVFSLNISPTQFYGNRLINDLENSIKNNQIPPKTINIEITENFAMSNTEEIIKKMNQIANLGCGLAIDDMGSGNSSLQYLKYFPISELKLDKELVDDLTNDKNLQEIVKGIVKICTALDITIVAEFVETQEQRTYLEQIGCDLYQGWYYSKSLPPEECENYIRKHNNI